jgi:hypothetical protein
MPPEAAVGAMADLLFNATRDAERVFKPLVTALKLQAPEPLKLKPSGANPPKPPPTLPKTLPEPPREPQALRPTQKQKKRIEPNFLSRAIPLPGLVRDAPHDPKRTPCPARSRIQ